MQYEKLGIVYLQEQLKTLDLAYFERLANENPQTLQNPQRMMRFVEVCIGTGSLIPRFKPEAKRTRFHTYYNRS
jgi:tRNA dimethylallyltransferase